MHAITRAAAALVAALTLVGCGSSARLQVQGVLQKGGAPFIAPEGCSNQVVFIVMDAKDESGKSVGANEPYAAALNQADATFEVLGPDGRGIPPGKYRVSVTQKKRNLHAVEKPKRRGSLPIDRDTDLLGDRFSPTSSPIVVEVTSSEKITIDLDRPTGSPSH